MQGLFFHMAASVLGPIADVDRDHPRAAGAASAAGLSSSYRDGIRVMVPLLPAVLARAVGLLAAAVAVLLRAPLLVVVAAAALTAALLRAF
jgi:hypothetical protein